MENNVVRILVKKYGRWNEDCNWQLEGVREKEVSKEVFNDFAEEAGFTYNEQYDEYFAISVDKLRMTVIVRK